MRILKDFIHFFYEKNLIKHSKIRKLFTKYGIFQAKLYKDGYCEYLVIMSRNFTELKHPLIYLYAESHLCDSLGDEMCYCNHQMDIALKLLRKEGGVVIYYSQDMKNIDGLLQEINARKLETKGDVMTKTRVTSTLKSYIREYQTIGFILKDLNLSSIKLVTHDTNIVEVAQQLGIDIIKLAPTITFDYGEQEG